ncbi:hypothetical protein BB558_007321 [Smittium angustum]|uniref:Chitin-binding type-2 domain-containing protein n=1 Tax=Smittium angustum TaxID=133377 RepID=A0A2U1IVC6_SMIAN|nr:hypothetical protein BB558_007321 [Smittium angustum]
MQIIKKFIFGFCLFITLLQIAFAQDHDDSDNFRPPQQNEACRGYQRCVPGHRRWYRECFHAISYYHRCPSGTFCQQRGESIRCARRLF